MNEGRPNRSLVEFSRLFNDDEHFDRSERIEVLKRLIPDQDRKWLVRFFLMLTLSVTIAVMGLAANSVAVVIGAMLIAPLMTPIMSFSAAVGLGLGRRAVQAAFVVAIGSLWSLLFSIVLSRLLPSLDLGSEILGRTSPDIRDLVVAIAAGAAGGDCNHEDVSATLPGVAVAVALVPPLAATGILIGAGEGVLAEGSALLYATNLFAIAFSALATLLITGVIPTARFFFRDSRMAAVVVGIFIATVAIAIPLTSRSLNAAESSRQQSEILTEIESWLGGRDLDVTSLEVIGTTVTVELTGLDEPPDAYALATRLVPVLGADAEVTVRWDARAQGSATAGTPPAADPTEVATEVLNEWIATVATNGIILELLEVTVADGQVDVVVSGPAAPPSSPELANDVAEAVGVAVTLDIRWIQSFDPTLADEPPTDRVARLVDAWVGRRSSVRVLSTTVNGSSTAGWSVLVDLAAAGQPVGLDALRTVLVDALPGNVSMSIRTTPLEVIDQPDTPIAVPSMG